MNGIIYCATFTNGRVYVGQTIQKLEERKSQHKWFATHHKDNFIFHRAIRKYGFDDITWETLEEHINNIEALNEREIFWIKEKNSYNKNNRLGCNMTPGGDDRGNLFKYTEEEAQTMVERYKECGNSSLISKEFGTTSSVIMRYVKKRLPDYKQYGYEGKGQRSLLTTKQKEEMYEYYKLTGSADLTMKKFNIKQRTFNRAMKDIDENYYQYQWNYKIPKQDVEKVWEEFKLNGKLETIAERYNVHSANVRELFKKIDSNYTQYTKRK